MRRIYHSASLLTINGKCENVQKDKKLGLKLNRYKTPYLKKNMEIRKIRNFLSIHLNLGIDIFLYNRGCFKLTIKKTPYFNQIVSEIEELVDKLEKIMYVIYSDNIILTKFDITQLVSILRWEYDASSAFKINYHKMVEIYECKNTLTWEEGNFIICHSINWVNYETGTSSIFFTIMCKTADKKIAGFKLYINLKIVLFTYDINFLTPLSRIIPEFVQKNVIDKIQDKNYQGE